jgi:D-Tyr-tRNAtyr deacylase
MQDLWIKQGKGFVLVYSITHQDSFEELKKIYAKIQRLRTGDK